MQMGLIDDKSNSVEVKKNGVVSQQTITWTNIDPDLCPLWRPYAAES